MALGDGVGLRIVSVKEDTSHSIIEIVRRQVYWARYIDVSSSASHPRRAGGRCSLI